MNVRRTVLTVAAAAAVGGAVLAAPAAPATAGLPATPAAAGADGCPVTAAELSAVTEEHLPMKADSVRCLHGWARAVPDTQSNGVYVYRYDTAKHAWRFVAAGSDLDCATIGMPPDVGKQLEACSRVPS